MWRFLKKLKVELPYDPAILILGIHLKKIIIQKDTSWGGVKMAEDSLKEQQNGEQSSQNNF